jgi:aminoglycoside phosphotransferase (APT) family kinase protein
MEKKMELDFTEIQSLLEEYYRRTFPSHQDAEITEIQNLTDGWESIMYAFKLVVEPQIGSQPQSLVLRIYPGTNANPKSQREFEGMQVLYRLGYPVPQVYHLERENSPFEKPFLLMERIDGELMWPVLDRAQPQQVAELIDQFCALFVRLHALDWQVFVPADQQADFHDPYVFIDGFLDLLRKETEFHPDLSAFAPVLDWLEARRDQVPCGRPAPVHWDFHPANVILKPDGSAVVIDWTQIQVSDPRFDLGWTLLLTGAYAGDEVREMILTGYQRILGVQVEQLAYFDVANCVKRLGSVMISLSDGADQMGMRPEAVESMRRDFPALLRVYNLMVDRTSIRIPEVEALLSA